MIRRLLALLILRSPLHAAAGRIVNVQSAASREAKEGLSGELSGLLNWTSGNTEVTQVSAGLAPLYLDGLHRLFLSAKATYGLDQGSAYINNTFKHLRYRYRLGPWLSPETFVQHEYDEFRRLSVRMLYGVGPRFEVPMPEGLELAFGSA